MNLVNSIPYYEQIKQEFYSRIERGILKEGDRLPSERELCEEFGVSRITIRHAIGLAIHEGMLESRPGKGTFVKRKKVARGFIKNTTFSEMIREMGKEPRSQILEWKAIPPTLENSKLVELFDTEKLINLIILGLADNEPSIVYSSFFPYQLGLRMLDKAKERVSKGLPFSSYDLYQDNVGTFPRKAHQTYEAIQANRKIANLLRVPVKSALFLIKSIFYAYDDRPIEYREATYRGDRFIFHVTREF